jgi:hypothetical protein
MTDAIKTVMAIGCYAPEFSYFRKQVGAIISPINSVSQLQEKTIDLESIKGKYKSLKWESCLFFP